MKHLWLGIDDKVIFYLPLTKLREGSVFSRVCLCIQGPWPPSVQDLGAPLADTFRLVHRLSESGRLVFDGDAFLFF